MRLRPYNADSGVYVSPEADLPHSSGLSLFSEAGPKHHLVQFYGADPFLLVENVCRYLAEGLRNGEGVLVIASAEHRRSFAWCLAKAGIDLTENNSPVVLLDARETLAQFMVDGEPDASLFRSTIRKAVSRMHRPDESAPIRAYGEMVDLLWQEGRISAAASLEHLWNELLEVSGYHLFCAYSIDIFDSGFEMANVDELLCAHTHLLAAGREGMLDRAVNQALHEVFGTKMEGLKMLMRTSLRPQWAEVPNAESRILWLRRNLPASAEAVLALARRYYETSRVPDPQVEI